MVIDTIRHPIMKQGVCSSIGVLPRPGPEDVGFHRASQGRRQREGVLFKFRVILLPSLPSHFAGLSLQERGKRPVTQLHLPPVLIPNGAELKVHIGELGEDFIGPIETG